MRSRRRRHRREVQLRPMLSNRRRVSAGSRSSRESWSGSFVGQGHLLVVAHLRHCHYTSIFHPIVIWRTNTIQVARHLRSEVRYRNKLRQDVFRQDARSPTSLTSSELTWMWCVRKWRFVANRSTRQSFRRKLCCSYCDVVVMTISSPWTFVVFVVTAVNLGTALRPVFQFLRPVVMERGRCNSPMPRITSRRGSPTGLMRPRSRCSSCRSRLV